MLKLQADPTFFAPVTIPTPSGPVEIQIQFKHMDVDAFRAFCEASVGMSDVDAIMDIAAGWTEVDGEFNRENVEILCKQYHQAAAQIFTAWPPALTQAKTKN